jgi:cysteinyl-tRNA synthetase
MGAIGVGIPDIEPRATEHIDEMIAMIEKLIAKGHAYEAEGHALFDVSSMKDYGKLSGKNQDELIAGARVEVALYKRTPCDFVLWKPAKEDEPGWDSPWGRGRPGWHIECSAMAEKHLGKQIDIHGGGQDLVFPHHENEVAQSSCAHDGLALARYWVHNGMLMVEGKKMSKSLGNFFTVSDVLALAPGDVIRYYILSTHYHQPFDWTKTSLEQARQSLNRLYTALANAPVEHSEPLTFNQLPQAFIDAIEDDLNTPLAFAVMHEWAGRLNKAEESEEILSHTYGQLLLMGKMLGIFTVAPATWLKGLDTVTDAEIMEIEALIKERIEARKTKDFARADEIRDILVNKDIILEDRSGETIWRKK